MNNNNDKGDLMMENNTDTNREFVYGQKIAFAAASLVLGICSFIHLLGMERAILAVIFGYLALKGKHGLKTGTRRTWAIIGIVLGCIMLIVVPVTLIIFWPQVQELVKALEKLS